MNLSSKSSGMGRMIAKRGSPKQWKKEGGAWFLKPVGTKKRAAKSVSAGLPSLGKKR